jgi:hypothetical protein
LKLDNAESVLGLGQEYIVENDGVGIFFVYLDVGTRGFVVWWGEHEIVANTR